MKRVICFLAFLTWTVRLMAASTVEAPLGQKAGASANGWLSSTDWVSFNGAVGGAPLTTKGDLHTFSTVDARLGVGADNFALVADSTQATGLKWSSAVLANPMTTAKDMIIGGVAGAPSRTPVGQIPGTATNDDAAAGFIGEYVTSAAQNVSDATSAQFVNCTTVTIPSAGDWVVMGGINFQLNGATVSGQASGAISINTGNTTTDHVVGDNELHNPVPTGSSDTSVAITSYRVKTTGSQIVYMKGKYGSITLGTPQFSCRISVRRVR